MKYLVNIETSWLVGIWSADRGSLAKGVVSLNNKNQNILDTFVKFSLKNFDITDSKIRRRKIFGYGISNEVYFTRLPARRFLENMFKNRSQLKRENLLAYFAGRLDGDGTVDSKNSILCYYYGLNEIEQLKTDEKILKNLGYKTSHGSCGKKALRMRVLKPRVFAKHILEFVNHPSKKENIIMLINKRHYGA